LLQETLNDVVIVYFGEFNFGLLRDFLERAEVWDMSMVIEWMLAMKGKYGLELTQELEP
jgi:hypothetical protein